MKTTFLLISASAVLVLFAGHAHAHAEQQAHQQAHAASTSIDAIGESEHPAALGATAAADQQRAFASIAMEHRVLSSHNCTWWEQIHCLSGCCDGTAASAEFANAAVALGDATGDGVPDVAVSANNAHEGTAQRRLRGSSKGRAAAAASASDSRRLLPFLGLVPGVNFPRTDGCRGDDELQDTLCYDPCREGYTGVGPVCWAACPDGFTDAGWLCTDWRVGSATHLKTVAKSSYGRGAGRLTSHARTVLSGIFGMGR